MIDIQYIETEQRNELTGNIDQVSTLEMVQMINNEDKKVALAVEDVLEPIARAIDLTASRLRKGGRLFYCGCGTSGRIGIIDAVECPPTYSTDPELVQGIIAGGYSAVFKAVEGAEDDSEAGASDLKEKNISKNDVVVGISASGRAPYVLGAMEYAKSQGSAVISVSCCQDSQMGKLADIDIAPMPGPEVITGSTRMKSGTAQKMVLNMLSTGTMVKLGKVYGNLMVDVKPSNQKLISRCVTIVCSSTGVDKDTAVKYLEKCGYSPKTAIVMILCGVDEKKAHELLTNADEKIAQAIKPV